MKLDPIYSFTLEVWLNCNISHWSFWIMLAYMLYHRHWSGENFIHNSVVSIELGDGLVPKGTRTSTGTMTTKFGWGTYAGSELMMHQPNLLNEARLESLVNRVRSWNNGMCWLSLYILMTYTIHIHKSTHCDLVTVCHQNSFFIISLGNALLPNHDKVPLLTNHQTFKNTSQTNFKH